MKTILNSLAGFALVALTMLGSCAPSKNMRASTARITQLEQDNNQLKQANTDLQIRFDEQTVLLKEKDAVIIPNSPIGENKMPIETPTEEKRGAKAILIRNDAEGIAPFPPAIVASVFNVNYPDIKKVLWTKETSPAKPENAKVKDYKANFMIAQNNHSVIYSQDGELIETREQILPAQLPPTIVAAIKSKYPDSFVVSAHTFKNKKIEGAYAATIRSKSLLKDTEIILMENGTIVK